MDYLECRTRLLSLYAEEIGWAERYLGSRGPKIDLPEPQKMLLVLLCLAYRTGPHNLGRGGSWLLSMSGGDRYAKISVGDYLSTYDSDTLTRLVLGAHEVACRVSIETCNPQRLRVRLWFRGREGGFGERHPTIEGAVADVRDTTSKLPWDKILGGQSSTEWIPEMMPKTKETT